MNESKQPLKELKQQAPRMSANAEPREDFLEEDQEIPGQKFFLVSFLSPEKVLANKDTYFFTQFVKDYEIQYKTKQFESFLASQVKAINDKLEQEAVKFEKADLSGAAQLCRESVMPIEHYVANVEQYVRKNLKEITTTKIQEDFDDFLFKNRVKLEDEFYAQNNFRTTVRGFKIRGVYGQQGEAVARSKKLQRTDPIHNIYVAEVGKWIPWDPNPNDITDQEYAEEQLNTLMKKYKENEEAREQFHTEQRKKNRVQRGVHTIGGDQSEADGSLFGPRSNAAGGNTYSGMFDGPADLALERKIQKKEEKKKEEEK